MKIQGKIKRKLETKTVGSNGFETREIHVVTEEQYPQTISIHFTQGRVILLDAINEGDTVEIEINLKGREWTNPEGKLTVFNTIDGWKINKIA